MVFLTDMAMAAVALGTAGWVVAVVAGLGGVWGWMPALVAAAIGMAVIAIGESRKRAKGYDNNVRGGGDMK